MLNCLFVGIGGFIGSVARYLIGLLPIEHDSGFPFKTLAINVLGAFLIGIIVTVAERNKAFNPQLLLMIKVGICGGFTTFSTFAYETAGLMKNGSLLIAISYVCISVILSVGAIFLVQWEGGIR